MKIEILRVLGIRAQHPTVLAIVDGFTVRWTPKEDWSCSCDELTFPDCPHIPGVENVIAPRILGAPK